MWALELMNRTQLFDLLDETASYTKAEILDYAENHGAPRAALELLQALNGEEIYESVLDIWPDMPTTDDEFGGNDDE
jgi:hypothetical protein